MKLKELIKKLKYCFTKKYEYEVKYGKSIYTNNKEITSNIYDEKTIGESARNSKELHINMKYRIMVPLCALFRWRFGKSLKKDIPDHKWNKNLKIFNEVVNDSAFFWFKHFIMKLCNKKQLSDEEIRKQMDRYCGCFMPVLTFKELLIKLGLDDTAYRELINIIMFKMYERMSKEYGAKHKHLFYNTYDACKVEYYRMCWNEVEHIQKIEE